MLFGSNRTRGFPSVTRIFDTMNLALRGVLLAFGFATIGAVQDAFFGGVFQHMNAFAFRFLAFGISVPIFPGGCMDGCRLKM